MPGPGWPCRRVCPGVPGPVPQTHHAPTLEELPRHQGRPLEAWGPHHKGMYSSLPTLEELPRHQGRPLEAWRPHHKGIVSIWLPNI